MTLNKKVGHKMKQYLITVLIVITFTSFLSGTQLINNNDFNLLEQNVTLANRDLNPDAYDIDITDIVIEDTNGGNGNNAIDYNETFNILVTLENNGQGTSPINYLTIQDISCISYDTNCLTIPSIPAGSSVSAMFTATSSASVPVGETLTFSVSLNYPNESIEHSQDFLTSMPQIGDGTLTDEHFPMESYFVFSYSQTIYTASELSLDSCLIDKIAYQYNGASAWTNDIVIYMGNTIQSSYLGASDWVSVSQQIEVYNGPFTVPDSEGWVEIELDTPFNYDGEHNLVISFDENTDTYGGNNEEFYCYDSGSPRSNYYYNDVTNPDPASPPNDGTLSNKSPNIRIYPSGNIPEANIFLNTNTLNFGQVRRDEVAVKALTIRNQGSSLLTASLSVNNDFSVQVAEDLQTRQIINKSASNNGFREINLSLEAHESQTYYISHPTDISDTYYGELSISSNDPQNSDIYIPLELNIYGFATIDVNTENIELALQDGETSSRDISITNTGDLNLYCSLQLQTNEDRVQTEIFSANFDDNDLTDWEHAPVYNWHIMDNYNNNSINGSPFLFIAAEEAGTQYIDDIICTPTFNVSAYSEIIIEFDHFFCSSGNQRGKVDLNIGQEMINIGNWHEDTGAWGSPSHFTYSLRTYEISQVQIYFQFYNASSTDRYWAIDNLLVTGVDNSAPEWVTMDSEFDRFTVAPNSSENITLNFSSIEHELGQYSGNLNIQSTSTTNSSIDIPIALSINEIELITPENVNIIVANDVTTLSWEAVPNADYYVIEFCTDSTSWGTLSGHYTTTSYMHLHPGARTHFYRIKAFTN